MHQLSHFRGRFAAVVRVVVVTVVCLLVVLVVDVTDIWHIDVSFCHSCLVFCPKMVLAPCASGGDESLFGCSWTAIVSALEQGTRPPCSFNTFSPGTGGGGDEVLRVRCPEGLATPGGARRPEVNGISFDEVRVGIVVFWFLVVWWCGRVWWR